MERPTAAGIGAKLMLVALVVGDATVSLASDPADEAMNPDVPREDAPIDLTWDARDDEVIYYARAHGVSIERALEISVWMDRVLPLLGRIQGLTDIFADARFLHGGSSNAPGMAEGEVGVEISVTNPNDANLVGLLELVEELRPGAEPARVVVKEVPRTLSELDAIANAGLEKASAGSIEVHYNFDEGVVTFSPAEGPRLGYGHANKCSDLTGGRLEGGRAIRISNPNVSYCSEIDGCTTGFPMRFSATYGVTTAGHCLDIYATDGNGFVTNHTDRDTDLYQITQPTLLHASTNAYWYTNPFPDPALPETADIGYLRRIDASVDYMGRLWKYSTGEWRGILEYESTWATKDQTVCVAASAAATTWGAGQYCGRVEVERANAEGDTTGVRAWTEVDFSCPQQVPVDPEPSCHGPGGGASGGPVYFGNKVYGIYTNADLCIGGYTLCTPGRYYRVDSLFLQMRLLTPDVYFICYPTNLCEATG